MSRLSLAPSFAPVGPTTQDGVPLAGWGWRVLAYLLDGLIIAVPNALATLPAQIDLQRKTNELTRTAGRLVDGGPAPDVGAFFTDYLDLFRSHAVWLFVPGIVIVTAYFAGMWRWRGASVGQRVMGIQVRPVGGPGRLGWPTVPGPGRRAVPGADRRHAARSPERLLAARVAPVPRGTRRSSCSTSSGPCGTGAARRSTTRPPAPWWFDPCPAPTPDPVEPPLIRGRAALRFEVEPPVMTAYLGIRGCRGGPARARWPRTAP